MKLQSNILKLCLFATGLSGIVAEYILATLATYFLGDSVIQWTMILSVMLFSMGLGSRLSKYIEDRLLNRFIYIEFILSLLVAYASLIAYTISTYTVYTGFVIYLLSILIGLLIGMEIPLVVRLNDSFEALRINVSSVLEKDYYGSLAGGLFFAFVGLPYFGLTYTPLILGVVNFSVALLLLIILWSHLEKSSRRIPVIVSCITGIVLITGFFIAKPVILFGEQKKYKDKVIYSHQSLYQKIVITKWKQDYWLYINGNHQLSSLDEPMYHEPLVHPALSFSKTPYDVLVMGGGDGCAVREILKYDKVRNITVVDLDPAMTDLGRKHPVMLNMNQGSLNNSRVRIINEDGYTFLQKNRGFYDVIIIDLPDPRSVELGRLYSHEFYMMCNRRLRTNGVIVTQAGSPYYAARAFKCINETMRSAKFTTAMLHNQILTLGEWGWIIGVKDFEGQDLKNILRGLKFKNIQTSWLNNEAMSLMTSFGKDFFDDSHDPVKINKIHDPVLYGYYLKGNWENY
ncbi:MAG: polyamine aminopropyltransferase [Desulfobacteraceae bacterium]|nr:polyamine aminopropyltransferase [Desulfobacteraceae bacterium]